MSLEGCILPILFDLISCDCVAVVRLILQAIAVVCKFIYNELPFGMDFYPKVYTKSLASTTVLVVVKDLRRSAQTLCFGVCQCLHISKYPVWRICWKLCCWASSTLCSSQRPDTVLIRLHCKWQWCHNSKLSLSNDVSQQPFQSNRIESNRIEMKRFELKWKCVMNLMRRARRTLNEWKMENRLSLLLLLLLL